MTRKKAIRLAINAIRHRRQRFSVGYNAYQYGDDSVWAERDFKKYVELSEAIKELSNG